jgi:DNA-binding Lrp family transcriptional regulator
LARRSKKTVKIDKRDETLIRCIEDDPQIFLKAIPAALKAAGSEAMPYATVQRRVGKLTEAGILKRAFLINWAEAGYLVRYRVGISIDTKALKDESIKEYHSQRQLADYIMTELVQDERFKNKLVVDDVFILLGGTNDLALDFFARDDKTATQFIVNGLRGLPGIRDTFSAKLAYSSKYGWLSKDGNDEQSK